MHFFSIGIFIFPMDWGTIVSILIAVRIVLDAIMIRH